jgi:hypothetical protein
MGYLTDQDWSSLAPKQKPNDWRRAGQEARRRAVEVDWRLLWQVLYLARFIECGGTP